MVPRGHRDFRSAASSETDFTNQLGRVPAALVGDERGAEAARSRMCVTLGANRYRFELSVEAEQGTLRIHVEQGASTRSPASALVMEYGSSITNCIDRFDVLHVATYDCLEANVNRDESGQQTCLHVPGKRDVLLPVAVDPPQSPRSAQRTCQIEELGLQLLTLHSEAANRPIQLTGAPAFPKPFPEHAAYAESASQNACWNQVGRDRFHCHITKNPGRWLPQAF